MLEARQTPTYERYNAEFTETDGEMGARLASAFFGDALPWQEYVLSRILARNGKDKYAYHALGLSIPRQNGKSWVIRARCFYGLVTIGEKILYTCQHGDTADEMFRDLANIFEDEFNTELNSLLKTVRKTNGQQSIYLNNGGYIRFTTRTNSLARGRSYDVLIYDEAQELTAAQQAASLPTISASTKHNTQVVYLGTPPNGEVVGTVFADMHKKAHGEQTPNFAWLEWSADKIGDVNDRKRWYETNPSLGELIDETAVEGELSMSSDDFARERLGWWSPVTAIPSIIPPEVWQGSKIKAIANKYRKKTALGLKFSVDGSTYALAGAKINARGECAFELIEVGVTDGGTDALAEKIYERKGKVAAIAIDGINGAGALIDKLNKYSMPKGFLIRPTTANVITAATSLLDLLKSGSAKHSSQSQLDVSALHAIARPIGRSGGWGYGSDGTHMSEPIEACALAVWAVRNTKRNPHRKQRLL